MLLLNGASGRKPKKIIVKKFYMHCLGALIKCKTFQIFENTFYHIIKVVYSPCEQDDSGNVLAMEESLQFLLRVIGGYKVINKDDALQNNAGVLKIEISSDNNTEVTRDIKNWLDSISERGKPKDNELDGRPNRFHSTKAAHQFLRIAAEFPLWSAVMVDAYRSPFNMPSSSSVEGEFSQLKNCILKGESKPLRIDNFYLYI